MTRSLSQINSEFNPGSRYSISFKNPSIHRSEEPIKKIYSRPTERDAVLLTDLEGDSIEISGQDMIKAKKEPDGFNKLYRRLALPHFCKDGGDLEVISMTTKQILWSSRS